MPRKIFLLTSLMALLVLTGASCINFGGSTAQGPMGMFRSVDKGENWVQINAYPTNKGLASLSGIKVYRVYNDPSDNNAYYLASRGQGLFFTLDNGDTWQAVKGMEGKFIYGLAVDPKDKCTVYASDGPHVYKTIDCLRTWQLVYTEERPNQRLVSLAVDFGNSAVVYGAEIGGDIIISPDYGRSWRVVKRFDFELQQLSADPYQPKRIYVASGSNGLFRSDDNGVTWVDSNAGLEGFNDSKNFYRLILNPGQKDSLFWISKYGILRSDDAGVTFTDLKLLTPPGSVNIYAFAINPNNQKEMYYSGTILGDNNTHVRSTFYKSTDGGVNWVTRKLPTNTIPMVMWVQPKSNSMVFMGFATLD